jgi:hypothetical protein
MHPVNKKAAIISGCFLVALIFFAPPAIHGDEWNLATRFTVNTPFEVPNLVLQPNTPYVIRLHDSPAERNVVQIFNDDQSKMLTMFMAVSDERTQPTDKTLFTFIETSPGFPLPMKEWFYPGRLRGLEFVYPKQQAKEIAQHAREPILTEASVAKSENPPVAEEQPSVAENVAPEPVQRPADEGLSTQIAQNGNEPNLKSESEEVQREKPAETPVVTEEANPARELPKTAGELPLIALIGTLCLGAGLGIRAISSRS